MKKQNGITLISLIITIIVMLILAGVALSIVMGDGSMVNQATTAKDNTRAGMIQEQIGIALNKNKIAEYEGDSITKEELVSSLLNEKLITDEEAAMLDNRDEIVVGDITIDFSKLEDDGFDYIGRKYLIADLGYATFVEGNDINIYDENNNIISQIPSTCITYNKKLITLTGTGDYDGNYKFSDDDHYLYVIDPENNEEYLVGVEEGYCKHKMDNGHPTWVDYDFSDMSNPILRCPICGEPYESVVIDGILYAYNINLELVEGCVDVEYDENINGYCALVIDKTKEIVEFEDQINGIDVVRVSGFIDRYDNNTPAVKKAKLPARVKELWYAFAGCSNLIEVSPIPSTVTNMYYTFARCTSLTGEIEINTNNLYNDTEWKRNGSCQGCFSGTTHNITLTGTASDSVKSLLAGTSENGNIDF